MPRQPFEAQALFLHPSSRCNHAGLCSTGDPISEIRVIFGSPGAGTTGLDERDAIRDVTPRDLSPINSTETALTARPICAD
ncbi:MAG TPA: hypothetical protein VGH20_19750 [Myxococcales bacterium]